MKNEDIKIEKRERGKRESKLHFHYVRNQMFFLQSRALIYSFSRFAIMASYEKFGVTEHMALCNILQMKFF
jgi:hypothetical protein